MKLYAQKNRLLLEGLFNFPVYKLYSNRFHHELKNNTANTPNWNDFPL